MSEIRKPDVVFLLKKSGIKTAKIELFDSEQWGIKQQKRNGAKKYRVMAKGRWFPFSKNREMLFYDKWQIRDLIWRSFDF